MNFLVLTRGCPGSSKSTWIKENGLEPYTLSADTIRLQIQGPILTLDGGLGITQKNDKRVWELLMTMLEDRMKRGEFCVIDSTMSKASDFAKYKNLVEKYRYRIICVDFSDVPLDECLKRNKMRESYKFVPEEAVKNLWTRTQTQPAPAYVKVVKPANFWEEVAIKPLEMDGKYDRIVVFGDIHSCWDPIKEYLEKYPYDPKTYYISENDLFDRGLQTKEVLQWLIEWHNRPNFLMLISNHGNHFHKYAFDMESEIRSSEFLYQTKPAIEEMGLDKGLLRNICRRVGQMALMRFAGKTIFCTHGGVPIIPKKMVLVASHEFAHGTGKYEDLEKVIETWNNKMPEDVFQVACHRNLGKLPIINGRYMCLEGQVEFGGHLRIVHFEKDGSIIPIEIKNNNYRGKELENAAAIAGVTLQTSVTQSLNETNNEVAQASNTEWVTLLRASNDIYEMRQGDISSFSFKRDVFFSGKWTDLSKVARGLFINNVTNEVVARFDLKRFNINEKEETRLERLKETMTFPAVAYHKYNGFLGLLGYDSFSDKLIFTSKSSITSDFAGWFEDIMYRDHGEQLMFIKKYLKDTSTCMSFEVIDPINDPHIIRYDRAQVILLDIFKRSYSPEKLNYADLTSVGNRFGLKVKEAEKAFSNWDSFWRFYGEVEIDESRVQTGGTAAFNHEGWVIEDYSGAVVVKLKTPYYRFWKFMRGEVLQRLSKGQNVHLGKLTIPIANQFYGFCKSLGRDELDKSNIIEMREKFLTSEHFKVLFDLTDRT